MLVDLNGHDLPRFFGEQRSQRAHTRTDFQHHVLGPDVGGLGQQFDQVQVDQKVLTVPRVGLQTDLPKSSPQV